MIINLRGTSGSGKSTIIHRVMDELFDDRKPRMRVGRRQPLGYHLWTYGHMSVRPINLFVVGHYETPCGGCDTINGYDYTFNLIREMHERYGNVLFEGLLLSGDVKRITELHGQVDDLRVIALDTPLDVCLQSVNERRRLKNPEADDVNPKTTTAKFKGVQNAVTKFTASGMSVQWANRDKAFELIKQWLKI